MSNDVDHLDHKLWLSLSSPEQLDKDLRYEYFDVRSADYLEWLQWCEDQELGNSDG